MKKLIMSEEDIITFRRSLMGNVNEDGSLIDYSVVEETPEELDDVQDDDAPVHDSNIDIISNVIKVVYTTRYRDIITERARLCCEALLAEPYDDGMSLQEYRASVGSNHLGSINSGLSIGICGKISQQLKRDRLPYITRDGDRVDWQIGGGIGVTGDSKMALASKCTLDCFTGNGSSNKEGYYWLNGIKLDDTVPMKETTVTHMYGGVIAVRYVSNLRSKGKSDRSSIKIKTIVQHRLCNLYGSVKSFSKNRSNKWLQFRLFPIYDTISDDLFPKETE